MMQYFFRILPCVWLDAVYLPNFPAWQPGASSPIFFESTCRFKIYLLHFTVHMTWCSLSPKFHWVTIRRHFAVYIAICMPFCNLSSEFYHAYDLVHLISQISLRDSPASVRRFSSDLQAVFKFSFRILPCVRQDAFYLPNSTEWQIGASLPLLLLFAGYFAIYLPDFTICATWSVYLPNSTERQFGGTLPVYCALWALLRKWPTRKNLKPRPADGPAGHRGNTVMIHRFCFICFCANEAYNVQNSLLKVTIWCHF